MEDRDGFQVVSGRRRAPKNKTKAASTQRSGTSFAEAIELPVSDIVASVRKKESMLRDSTWYAECCQIMDETIGNRSWRLRCRGIGCVGRAEIAQLQCACALLLQERYGITESAPEFCEPLLSEAEREALARLGFVVAGAITGPRECNDDEEHELLYMPHCPAGLYHEELRLRWSLDALARICIVGNSFENYFLRLPENRAPIIRKTEHFVIESQLPNASFADQAFNDTSLHVFRGRKEAKETEILEPLLESDLQVNDPAFIT